MLFGTHGAFEICHIGAGQLRSAMAAQPLFVSSGDLVADRRYQWALDYLPARRCCRRGRHPRAGGGTRARLRLRLVRAGLDPRGDWATATAPIAAFAAARDADREDYHGARLHLARLGVGEATPAMTGVYVRALFDQYAPDFDAALVERLDYRAPELLLDAVRPIDGHAVAVRLGARSRLRHRAWRRGVPAASATGWSASTFRRA